MISAGESVVISAGECCDFGRGAIRGLISAGVLCFQQERVL